MAYGFVPIIHIITAVFAIVELGLTAYGKLLTLSLDSARAVWRI